MPLYEYECDACGQRFEQIQSFSDPPVEKCPTCGGPVRKLMSNPAFQFKGSGWYITDYARKGGGGGEKKASGGDGTGAASGKTEASEGASKTSSKPDP